jgi:acyl-CoA thioester hydrolase
MTEQLQNYPVVIELPILWGHMDAFQHINNIMFFRFFESARIAYFERIGFLDTMERTGIGPILASTHCKYISPLTYPDTIHIGTRITEHGKDKFTMEYLIVSKANERIAATGTAKVVCYDYNRQQKADLPQDIIATINNLEEDI